MLESSRNGGGISVGLRVRCFEFSDSAERILEVVTRCGGGIEWKRSGITLGWSEIGSDSSERFGARDAVRRFETTNCDPRRRFDVFDEDSTWRIRIALPCSQMRRTAGRAGCGAHQGAPAGRRRRSGASGGLDARGGRAPLPSPPEALERERRRGISPAAPFDHSCRRDHSAAGRAGASTTGEPVWALRSSTISSSRWAAI